MSVRSVSVSVDDDHVDQIGMVVEALQHRGMTVDRVLGTLGVISGSIEDDARPALFGVEGVVSVDEAVNVQLPPPGSGQPT